MKTKNMRKKALLSSVAMLLVAVVALGGATYAWFTTNSSVKASGVNLSTSEEANLFLNTAGSTASATGWTEDYNLATDYSAIGALEPASSVDAINFFSISAYTPGANEESYIAKTIANSGVYRDLQVAVMSGKANMDLKVSTIAQRASTGEEDIVRTNDDFWKALRVAVSADGGSTFKIYSPGNDQTYAIKTYTPKDGENGYQQTTTLRTMYDIAEGTKNSIQGLTFDKPNFANANTTIVTLGSNVPVDLTIRFWLEGNDEHANNRAISKFLDGIYIQFTASAHPADPEP